MSTQETRLRHEESQRDTENSNTAELLILLFWIKGCNRSPDESLMFIITYSLLGHKFWAARTRQDDDMYHAGGMNWVLV